MGSPHETLSQSTATRRKKEPCEKTLYDTDFFEDAKIQEIEAAFGDAASSWYQRIAFRILREGGPIRFAGAVAILSKTQCGARATEFLELCIEVELFYREGTLISSARADREIEALATKRDKWREKKRIPKPSPQTPPPFPGDSPENPEGIPEASEKEEEKEGEEDLERDPECIPIGIPSEPDLPDELAELADAHLESVEVAAKRDFNQAMIGRRPMKKYPTIWLEPRELKDAAELYEQQGIPPEHFHLGFRFTAEWLKGELEKGRPKGTLMGKIFMYLTDMGLQKAKTQYCGFLDVERKKNYGGKK